MSMPKEELAAKDEVYIIQYGEARFRNDLVEFEKITNRDWGDAFEEFHEKDPTENGLEKFHKEIIIKLLNS